jgi:hypothetical protein
VRRVDAGALWPCHARPCDVLNWGDPPPEPFGGQNGSISGTVRNLGCTGNPSWNVSGSIDTMGNFTLGASGPGCYSSVFSYSGSLSGVGCESGSGEWQNEGMIRATGLPESRFSTSCFSGAYPVDIGDRAIAGPLKGALSTCRRPA